jgi:hypothetical protein
MCAVAMEPEGLADPDQEACEGPAKSGVIMPPYKNKKQYERLSYCQIRTCYEVGFCQRLFQGKAVLLQQKILLGTKVEFDLSASEECQRRKGRRAYLFLVQRCDRSIVYREHQGFC